ncbi:glycosyltransferase family 39 protein [Oculatella sp. LEGE 06141]|uniref:ArnT family glycosyltransferase n=1 Tax=Oculatella sp. LEGE 06141 TaxID=1828648 RepID=UPI00188235C4|nr:glycosyltransferase family 39 protein [Oculatella sp. LEGE 06141]MBE9178404.1 glycosyltransferase family 39 protein [Oculatella sp. LEGE 06141]
MNLRIDRPIKYLSEQWEKQPIVAWILSMMWVGFIGWLAFGWHLGSIGLVDETEPLFAEAARQMTVTGDWITPYFNGTTRFDKPPLVYWLMAIGYQTIGVNEWAARLPSALAAIALTAMGFYTLRYFGFPTPAAAQAVELDENSTRQQQQQRWLAAWIGAALIALNPQTIVWGRTGVSDMLLSGCMGGALFAFFCGYAQPHQRQQQTRWYLAFYGLSALAVLTKGPVGIILPVLVIGTFLLYVGNLRPVLAEMYPLRGGLLFLAITLPWYILVILANGQDYIDAFFGYHNFERFTSVVNHHAAPWYFYFVVVLVGFLPWSLFLPVAIARLRFWQLAHWRQQPRSAHLGLFAAVWFVVIFAFFTIAVTKLPSYVLPLLPAAAVLVALMWSDQMGRSRLDRGILISSVISVGVMVILAGAMLYSPNWMGDDPAMPGLPQAMRQTGILKVGCAIWLLAAVGTAILLVRRQGRWVWSTVLAGLMAFVAFTVIPAGFVLDVQRQLPLRQLAALMVQAKQPDEALVMVGFQKPSLVFYARQPVLYLSRSKGALNSIQADQPDLTAVLVIGYPEKLDDLELQPAQYSAIAAAGAYAVIRVPLPVE